MRVKGGWFEGNWFLRNPARGLRMGKLWLKFHRFCSPVNANDCLLPEIHDRNIVCINFIYTWVPLANESGPREECVTTEKDAPEKKRSSLPSLRFDDHGSFFRESRRHRNPPEIEEGCENWVEFGCLGVDYFSRARQFFFSLSSFCSARFSVGAFPNYIHSWGTGNTDVSQTDYTQ